MSHYQQVLQFAGFSLKFFDKFWPGATMKIWQDHNTEMMNLQMKAAEKINTWDCL